MLKPHHQSINTLKQENTYRNVTESEGLATMKKKGPDPFYKSETWKALRSAVIRRSRGNCEAPGCTSPGRTVDHIVSRKRGGPDTLDNLRHLCPMHDNQIKEDAQGNRRGGATFKPNAACGPDGLPIDRSHPFYSGEGGTIIPAYEGAESAGGRVSSKFRGPK